MTDSIERINYLKATVRDADADTRIKKWLLKHYRHIVQSQECCRSAFKRNEVSVNGQLAEETRILRAGDVVEVRYDRGIVERQKLKAIAVDIRYEDEHMAVVWKAPGQSFGMFEKALVYALTNPTEQDKFWCPYSLQKAASGLLIVAKTEQAKADLAKQYQNGDMQIVMRAICHGRVPPDLLDHLQSNDNVTIDKDDDNNNDDDDDEQVEETIDRPNADSLKSFAIVGITRSNHAEYLTTLDLDLRTPIVSTAIRLLMHEQKYPIVGNSTYTRFLKSSKDKGLCMSVLRVGVEHPVTKQWMAWQAQEPDKFELLRAREHKFWRRRVDEKLDAMRKAGVSMDATGGDDFVDGLYKEGKPLAYVLGEKEFYKLRFKVTEACLVPRPSSETLVNAAIKLQPQRVLDIGTGCGNLLLAILSQCKHATGVGLDISGEALQVAEENAKRLKIDGAQFVQKDMTLLMEAKLGLFDVVVCNPPYLSEKAVSQHRMLEHEPATALFANDDGYEWYTVLSKVAPTVMHRQSKLVLECGKGMMERVQVLMAGWRTVEVGKDSQGWNRCLVLQME